LQLNFFEYFFEWYTLSIMTGYKYLNIDSGATPIGSTGRAPDKKTISRKNSTKIDEEEASWSL
jgi:hypothetical protein